MRQMMQLSPDERTEDQRKIFAWTMQNVGDAGVFAWTEFEHPDFGKVEIGGLDPKFVVQNPPLSLLEEECISVSAFLTRLGLSTAKLIIPTVRVSKAGEGLYHIVAEVSNAGFLPTSSTQKGKELLLEGVYAYLEGSFEVVAGASPSLIGHLDGYGNQSTWAPPKSQQGFAEWVVRAEAGTKLTVAFSGLRAGRATSEVILVAD